MNRTACLLAILAPLSLVRGSPQEDAAAKQLYDQGTQAVRAKDLAAAEKAFHAGLERAVQTSDRSWTARFSQSLGELELGRGQFREALDDYSRALASYDALSDAASAASVLDVLGQIQARLGRFEDAEKSLTRAIAVFAAAGNARRTAKVRGSLADLYVRRSDFRAALEAGFAALPEDEKAGDSRETAKVLDVLGNAFHLMGQSESALRYYRRALAFRESGTPADLAIGYRNMGASLAELDRYGEALDYFKKSMELGKTVGSWLEIANSAIAIGVSERALGDPAAAHASYEQALAVAEAHGYKLQAATSLYSLGDLALAAGDLDRAMELHERALKIRQEAHSPREVVFSLNRLGIVLEDRGELKAAEAAHEQALGEFERIGAGISDPTQYGAYRRTSVVLYPHYARVLFKLGKTREALRISERSRGVGLARMTALSGANFVDRLSAEDARAWQDVSARMGRASNQLRVLEEATPSDEQATPAVEKARASYFQSERELWNLRDRLFAATPGLRTEAAPAAATEGQLEELARKSPDTLFLEWMMVDGKSTLLFALSAEGLQTFELPTGPAELLAATNAWRTSLSAGAFSAATAGERELQSEEPRLARRLYELIFAKVAPLLESGKYARLALVGEGPLLDVPFPALMDAHNARLMDHFAISCSVSFEYLLRPPVRGKPGRSLLSVADPLGEKEKRLAIPSEQQYERLQDALPEAKAVAGMYRGSLLLAGPAAREAEVKRWLPEFQVLHFATHGILDAADGLRSGLLLATEPGDSAEDGVLQAWEILGMSLSARLVFLSACDTARGKERLGDGLLSLAWAFQAAGSPRVVASLWSVDDEATRELVTAFYAEVRRGRRADDALREAMRRERKNPRYAAPYFWSAFQILGDGSALQ